MKNLLYALLLAVGLCPVWGQIAQSRPEHCGILGDVSPPLPDISATIDQHGQAVLYIGRGSFARGMPLMVGTLPSLISEIAAVCPLSDGRLVVFGDMRGAVAVHIVDRTKASVVDSFWVFSPEMAPAVMSPDQRWIVYQKSRPLHGVAATDELLVYDLTKTPPQNRLGDDLAGVGRLIFPPGQNGVPYDNINVPEDQIHHMGRVYWAADSRALLFTDQLASNPKKIILVTLDDRGVPAAFEHEITASDVRREVPGTGLDLTIARVEIGPDRAGSRSVLLDLCCPPRVLQLHKDDFQPAKPEVHVREEPTGEAELMQEGGRTIRRMKRKK